MKQETEKEEKEREPLALWPKIFGTSWAAIAFLTTLSYWQSPYLLTLVSAFRFQLFWVLCLFSLAPILLFKGKKKLLFLGFPLAVGFTFAGYIIPSSGAGANAGDPIRVSVANIYSGNLDTSRLLAWLQENPSDVLGILENTPQHDQALRELGFEHVFLHPRQSNFGLALLCQRPPLKVSILDEETPCPSLLAEFENYQVLLTHPVPPISRETREMGDRQMLQLTKNLQAGSKPTIFMGDFNATAWDARLLPLREAGYRDARRGFGFLATWPVGRPWMQIPIDHIFIDDSFEVFDCARGPDIGSDHYPLRATLRLTGLER